MIERDMLLRVRDYLARNGASEIANREMLAEVQAVLDTWQHNHPPLSMVQIQRSGKCPECDRLGICDDEDLDF